MPSLDDLDKRVQSLENKFQIAIVVAGILGLGGAGIGTFLADAYRQIDKLRTQLETYKVDIATAREATIESIGKAGEETVAKIRQTKIKVGQPQFSRIFDAKDFWTSQDNTVVNYTCADNAVLGGINFVMHSDGVGRHPYRIEYVCKNLEP